MMPDKEAPLRRWVPILIDGGEVEMCSDPHGQWVQADEAQARIDERDAEIARLKAESIPRIWVEDLTREYETRVERSWPGDDRTTWSRAAQDLRALLDEEPEGDDE